LGLVAKASRSSQKMMYKPKPLTIARVLDTFRTIAKVISFLVFLFVPY
jgi:DNA ligase-1